jgi:NhaA family Na+:H+ antiporter
MGIFLISFLAVKMGLANLSSDLNWQHIMGTSLLGGIGFTMSIFITNLAFIDRDVIIASKISILLASFCAAIMGLIVLKTENRKRNL